MKRSHIVTSLLCLLLLAAFASPAWADTSYTVRWGDTLGRIASRFGVTVQAIAQANNIVNPNLIYQGQTLIIPTGDDGGSDDSTPPPPPPPGEGATYVVQPGDTLYRIALRFGVTVQAIAQANQLSNLNLIYVGQTLTIPGATGGSGSDGGTTPPPPPPPPSSSGGFELGGQTHSFGNVDTMRSADMTWVKFQHKWSNGDGADAVRGRIESAHAQGFKVLLSIPGSHTSSIDYNAYTDFLGAVAALGPDAIEVWNEMNIDREWPAGQISASDYVNNMLKPAYQKIKAANGNVMVISGAPAPTGFFGGCSGAGCDDNFYMQQMAAAGAASYADCIGIHYNEGILSPTQTSGDPRGNSGHYTRYFWGMTNTYWNAFGGSRPLCYTELGYLTAEGYGNLPGGFSWAADTSLQEHAQWLGEAASLARSSGKIRMLIVFNVDFTTYGEDPQAGYAIIRPGGGCPACATLANAMR